MCIRFFSAADASDDTDLPVHAPAGEDDDGNAVTGIDADGAGANDDAAAVAAADTLHFIIIVMVVVLLMVMLMLMLVLAMLLLVMVMVMMFISLLPVFIIKILMMQMLVVLLLLLLLLHLLTVMRFAADAITHDDAAAAADAALSPDFNFFRYRRSVSLNSSSQCSRVFFFNFCFFCSTCV